MSAIVPLIPRPGQSEVEATRDRLLKKLADRQVGYRKLNDYYEGRHPLAFTSQRFQEAFGGLFSAFADNWMQIVVDAVEERLNVEGFRLGADQDERGDADAWRIWQANQLDSYSQIAHIEALVYRRCPVLVWADDDGQPLITVESPTETVVDYEPGNRRRRRAALKFWRDGLEYCTLYLPGGIYKWQREPRVGSGGLWSRRQPDGEAWPLPNPLGVVPVVELINRPRLLGDGESEIANVIPTQDAVNKLAADMLVASEYAAYPQRILTGWEPPIDPETGEVVSDWQPKAAVSRVWWFDSEEVKWGQFEAASLQNYVTAIETLVQHIASQSRTPPHYFYLSGQFPSGESLRAAEAGLAAKARRKTRFFGETWEEAIRLAFAVLDDPRADVPDVETIWGDVETRTEAEHVDSVMKMQALGVPRRALWERLGATPQEIERWERAQARESVLAQGVDLTAILPTGETA